MAKNRERVKKERAKVRLRVSALRCAASRERESCCFSIDHALVNSNTNYNIIIIQYNINIGIWCVCVGNRRGWGELVGLPKEPC